MSSKYFTIATDLEKKIPQFLRENRSLLPSEYQLGKEYNVSRQTVRSALALLVDDGYIIPEQGKGYRLTGKLPSSDNTVCVMLPDPEAYIYPTLIKSLKDSFENNGFECRFYFTDNKFSIEATILKEIISISPRLLIIEGIMTAISNPNIALFSELSSLGTKILFLGSSYQNEHYSIGYDYFGEGGQVVNLLYKLGHKKIIGIFPDYNADGLNMQAGWLSEMLKKNNGQFEPNFYLYSKELIHSIRTNLTESDFFKKIISEFSDTTAIVCFNDEIAYWMIKGFSEYGYNCPMDVSITGADGSYLSQLSRPVISSFKCTSYVSWIIKYAGQILSGIAEKQIFIRRSFVETNSISRIEPLPR